MYGYHRAPTVHRLCRDFPWLAKSTATTIRGLIKGDVDPREVSPAADRHARQCYHPPGGELLALYAINELLEQHGIEGWTDISNDLRDGVSYSNAGDSYALTIAYVQHGWESGFVIADMAYLAGRWPPQER